MPQKLTKKNSCPRTCILSVLSLLSNTKSPNITLIKRFIDEFKYITNTFTSHQSYINFLKFLRSSKLVKCKIGLFYFEKYLLVSDYELIFFDLDLFYQNQFVNNKIILFSWLKPDHLEISLHPQYLEKVTNCVCDLNTLFTPSEKMAQIIEIAKIIYFFHGKNLSQENFLPIFIYTIIHFQIKNLIYNLNFIKRYFGIPMNKCKLNCLHLEECENEKCECVTFISDVNLKEQEFYLTNFEAATNFIEMIDFNLIKANVQEYCDNIERLTNFIDRTKIPKKIRKEASLAQKAKIKFVKISEFVKDYFKKNF